MQQRLAVFTTAKLLALSAMGAAASAASAANAASLSMQLNEPYLFFYLQLPLWFLFITMIVLTFVGAFLSLTTDYMRARGTTASKLTTAIAVGFVISFVVLPTITSEPNPALMMLTAVTAAFSGNKQLQDAVIDLIVQRSIKFLGAALDLLSEHTLKLFGAILVGIVASFVMLPQLNEGLDAQVTLSADYTEVFNV